MAFFPFYMDVSNKKIVIFGGGKTACRKAVQMLAFGADITVISPFFLDELSQLSDRNTSVQSITLIRKKFSGDDINQADFVIAATDDPEVNTKIYKACKSKKILVNSVDKIEECDFIFPAVIQDENVVISVSTGGESPLLAAEIKREIKKSINKNYGKISRQLGSVRNKIKAEIKTYESRKKAFQMLIDACFLNDGNLNVHTAEKIITDIAKTENLNE